jgi:anti-sigma B factor antagonist
MTRAPLTQTPQIVDLPGGEADETYGTRAIPVTGPVCAGRCRGTVRPVPEPRSDEPAGPETLSVNRREVDDVLVVRVGGEIDMSTGPQLQEAISESLDQMAVGRVIIDLNAVTFLGSVGLAALAEAAKQADERQKVLKIVVGNNRAVRRPIEATGMDVLLKLCDHIEQALGQGNPDEPPATT